MAVAPDFHRDFPAQALCFLIILSPLSAIVNKKENAVFRFDREKKIL